jgi:hypothetical protein
MYKRGDEVIYTLTGERGKVYSAKRAPVYWVRLYGKHADGSPMSHCLEIHERDLTPVEEMHERVIQTV